MDGRAEDARKALAVQKGFERRGDLGTEGRHAATSADGNSGWMSRPRTERLRVLRSWGRPKSLSGSGSGGPGILETPRDSDRRWVGERTSRGFAAGPGGILDWSPGVRRGGWEGVGSPGDALDGALAPPPPAPPTLTTPTGPKDRSWSDEGEGGGPALRPLRRGWSESGAAWRPLIDGASAGAVRVAVAALARGKAGAALRPRRNDCCGAGAGA